MKYSYKEKRILPFEENKYVRNRWLLDMFHRYEDYYRPEMSRLIHNQRMYWGINFGQWPAYVVEKLRQQGRRPHTFNILAKKVESQISSYISNGFDLKWGTVGGKNYNWATKLNDMVTADKSNCDWDTSKIICLRDFQCLVGYERMIISDRYDAEFGNIAYEPLPPTHIYISPSWKSPYANDIKDYFEWGMFLPSEIIEMFPNVAEELRYWKEREETTGVNYGEYHAGPRFYQSTEEKWGDYHKVITFHSVYNEERMWEYDLVNRMPFPETGFEPKSQEDREAKQLYMQRMGIQEGQYTTVKQKRKIKRIEIICPTLHNELFLASGKDRIQTNNCNIYPLGNQLYGQFRSMVDDLNDTQVDFNKNEMIIMDMQQRMAKGMVILDKALARGDRKKMLEIEKQFSNPAARVWVEEGSTAELGPNSGIIDIKGHPPTPDLFRQNERRLDLADWLSTVPAAMDSRTESTQESGKLYQSKVQVGLVSQRYGLEIYKRHEREKYQAYPLQAKITYAGFPREFSITGGAESIAINIPGVDAQGRRVVIDDISYMPEMRLTLVPSTNGVDIRTELREQFGQSLNALNDPKDRLLRLILVEGILEMQDMSEERKESIKHAAQLLINNAAMEAALENMLLNQKVAMGGMPPQQVTDQSEMSSVAPGGQFDEKKARMGTPQDSLL